MPDRNTYPSDVSDDEWAFVAPYLALVREDAPQRKYSLRHVFNAVRYVVRTGVQWDYLPHDFPPAAAVYQQALRWSKARVFEAITHDLRALIRISQGRQAQPSAVVIDSRTMQSTPESGSRADYDGYKRRRGSKVHVAVDTLGHLLSVVVSPANEQDRSHAARVAADVQAVTGHSVELAFVDQGYTGAETAEAVEQASGIALCVVKLEGAKRGSVLLPRRWVVERTFGWMSRFRRLARDYERLPSSLVASHFVAASLLMGRLVAVVIGNAPWAQGP
jgi:transposase